MSIPESSHFRRPALEFHADSEPHDWKDFEKSAAHRFKLTSEEQAELIPGGSESRLSNRVQLALSDLRKAGLLEKVKKGTNRITPAGRTYLDHAPQIITANDLLEFPEFAQFQLRAKQEIHEASAPVTSTTIPAPIKTPQETIDTAFEEYRTVLAQDLLQRVKAVAPARFEQFIVGLMLKLGYGGAIGVGPTLGRTGDEGVDGVINQDKLGLDKIYLQAKRWDSRPVGRVELQAFVAALKGRGASKGVFITSSTFTQEARVDANTMLNFKISLIDGLELARLMIEYDLGVALVQRYDVKRVDSDFFTEE